MNELYNVGLTEDEIKSILQTNPNIMDLTDIEIINNIEILKNINCTERQIKNILICNPFYLNKNSEDIINLIRTLIKLKIDSINFLLDSNPFLLDKESYEIDEFINKEITKGKKIDDIIDEFESNPYIID